MEDSVLVPGLCLIDQYPCFDKAEYEIVRNSILKHLLAYGAMTIDELSLLVKKHLDHKYARSLDHHFEFVLQGLEARGEIQHILKTHPPLIEITE